MTATDRPQAMTRCWVCGESRLRRVREGVSPGDLASHDFAITDARYGTTGAIDRCEACGFRQCSELTDVLGFYEDLEDPEYDEGRGPRALQARKLIETLSPYAMGKKLLDVGAGAGILVEEAASLGYDAVGVEPSRWLAERAKERGLNVIHGTLPHPDATGPFDVVTMIDVVEHVPDPIAVLRDLRDVLAPGGIAAVVTPDVGSMAARLLGKKWWHYRIAHIGYFDRATFMRALGDAGLEPVAFKRPGWYFAGDYLAERAVGYLPRFLRPPVPRFLSRLTVPLNLRDSLLAICRRKGDESRTAAR